MRMEVKMRVGVALLHLPHVLYHLQWIENAQGIRKHESTDGCLCQCIEHGIDILRRLLHAVAPVLQVEVHAHIKTIGTSQTLLDIGHMLLYGFLQLTAAVFLTTLSQQVHHLTARLGNPLDGIATIDEAQYLDTVKLVYLTGIAADHLHSILVAVAHLCRGHLDTVHVDVLQQHPGNHQLLVRQEAHAGSLLTIAQRTVHDLHERLDAVI